MADRPIDTFRMIPWLLLIAYLVVLFASLTKLFVKAGKPAKLEDAVIGEDAGGLLTKKDGKEEALSLRPWLEQFQRQ